MKDSQANAPGRKPDFVHIGDAASAVVRKIREKRKTEDTAPKPVAAE